MNIGDQIENFTLPITGTAENFTLADAAGKIVVLYFYPKDDTPGCTIESTDFSNLLDDFNRANAIVLGISRDNLRSHEKFRTKFDYQHHLLADTEAMLCERFSVLNPKKMFGKPVVGISRSTFVIDRKGQLAFEWRGIRDVNGHAAEVLEKVQTLS
ncbi:MAG: peroxiredoxin [Proteobacteria bacterium]|nr:peroxiredoxin [Pseudomonadota bacterium]